MDGSIIKNLTRIFFWPLWLNISAEIGKRSTVWSDAGILLMDKTDYNIAPGRTGTKQTLFTTQSYKTRWNVLKRWASNQKLWSVAGQWAVCWSEGLSSVVFWRSFHPLNASFSPIFTRSIQSHCMSKKTSVFSGSKNSEVNSRRTRTARNV